MSFLTRCPTYRGVRKRESTVQKICWDYFSHNIPSKFVKRMFSDVMIMRSQTVTTMSRQKLTKQFFHNKREKLFLISLTGISLVQKRQQTISKPWSTLAARAPISSVKCIGLPCTTLKWNDQISNILENVSSKPTHFSISIWAQTRGWYSLI